MGRALEDRFWEKVLIAPPMVCWEWIASKDPHGYGQIRTGGPGGGPLRQAHRVSYELHNGPIPAGLLVRHTCDNPGCVNPDHLRLGTQADNVQDMIDRGRARGGPPRGERNASSKLTEAQVVDIRNRYATGEVLQIELTKEFGVSQATISEIVRRRIWRHI